MKRIILILAAICLLSPCAFADQITLKNGDRLTGDIVRLDDKTLLLKSEFVGEVTIQWAAVDAIVSAQTLHVGLKDGQTVVGTLAAKDGNFQVQTKDTGTVMTAKDSIVVMRSDKEQTAYDAALYRLQHPHLLDFWGGYFDAGLSTTRGNSDTLSFVLGAKAIRDAQNDKITVYMNSIYAKNTVAATLTTPAASVTTAHAINGGIRADLNVNPKLFAFGFTDFEFDQFQMLDLRNVLGGGAGFHAIKTKRTVFDLSGGGAYDQAFYSTGTTIKSGELVLGEQLSYQISGRSSFSEQLQFFPNLSHTGQYRGVFDSNITTKLSSWLNWQVSFQDRYVSDPIPGIKNNDLLLSTGIRLTYGKGGN
jgi:putative salt-induced outer membrane protein YdiY